MVTSYHQFVVMQQQQQQQRDGGGVNENDNAAAANNASTTTRTTSKLRTSVADAVSSIEKKNVTGSAQAQPSSYKKKQQPLVGPTGCYLVFESDSGGRLLLQYSKGPIPDNAVAFWAPAIESSIPNWQFQQNHGRVELVRGIAGGDANRRKFYEGWCQFLKLAKAKQGRVIQFDSAIVAVDVYGYYQQGPEFVPLDEGRMVEVAKYDAVAVIPKHHEFLKGVKSINARNFLEKGSIAGASTTLS